MIHLNVALFYVQPRPWDPETFLGIDDKVEVLEFHESKVNVDRVKVYFWISFQENSTIKKKQKVFP